ncbi:GNAT family N-acetyltransferase [uncultured Roseibium sp.]|uniref:GNAT family N-acetyltransferase n=1 Tax=uncultured Roseibium sp. TaxID=1936171 RepID=UPI00344F1ED6
MYPGHLHLNLLPITQGVGLGRELLDRWIVCTTELGLRGVHVGVNARNKRAIRFWARMGFAELHSPRARTVSKGRHLT